MSVKTKDKIENWTEITTDFKTHLMALLPLYAVSHSGDRNQTIQYIEKFLTDKHPERKWRKDRLGNIVVMPVGREADSVDTIRRAMVAHTDTVPGQGRDTETILYNPVVDIIYNKDKTRPMGGDDKVGVAACLAVMPYRPSWAIYLVADEEVGCVGSRQVDIPDTMIACQLDRRGSDEITETISGTLCYTKKTKAAINEIIKEFPDLKWASGAMTDVGTLVSRGKVRCGSNFACGYYNPHSSDEFIRYIEAQNALRYAVTILDTVKDEDIEMAKNESTYSSHWGGGRFDGMWDEYYGGSNSNPSRATFPKDNPVDMGLFILERNTSTIVSRMLDLYGETPMGLVAPTSDEDILTLTEWYTLLKETEAESEVEVEEVPPPKKVETSIVSIRPSWIDNPPAHLKSVADSGWIPAKMINETFKHGVQWFLLKKFEVAPHRQVLDRLQCEFCQDGVDLAPIAPGTWLKLAEGATGMASLYRLESGDIVLAKLQSKENIVCPACATHPNIMLEEPKISSEVYKVLGILGCTSVTDLIIKLRGKRIMSVE